MARPALGVAFFAAPLKAEKSQVPQLNHPGNGVGGDNELMIEKVAFVHFFLVWIGFGAVLSVRLKCFLGFDGRVLLMTALHVVAQEEH